MPRLPVIDSIAADHPEVRILLTTATVTSAKLARTRLPKGALHQYVPLDNQGFVQRFLHHWRPDLAVLVESEIWPNLVLETKAQGIPAPPHQWPHVDALVPALAAASRA